MPASATISKSVSQKDLSKSAIQTANSVLPQDRLLFTGTSKRTLKKCFNNNKRVQGCFSGKKPGEISDFGADLIL